MGMLAILVALLGAALLIQVPYVGWLLAIAWVGLSWATSRALRAPEPRESTQALHGQPDAPPGAPRGKPEAATARAVSSPRKRKSYDPPRPTGVPTGPWVTRMWSHQVAGEYYYSVAATQLARRYNLDIRQGSQLNLPAHLVPAPTNPHDSNAVAVYVDSLHVGYLTREDAVVYHRAVAERAAVGELVTVPSRQWIHRNHEGRVMAHVTLRLPAPNGFAPEIGLPDDDYVVLPPGSTIQVTKEDEHMDALNPYVTGEERPIAVTLHSIVEIRPRSAVDAVEVRLLGERVGILTPTQTANVKPLVDYVEARGRTAVARAGLVGNQIKADVTLYLAKAQDVEQGWLDGLGDPVRRTAAHAPVDDWGDEPPSQ